MEVKGREKRNTSSNVLMSHLECSNFTSETSSASNEEQKQSVKYIERSTKTCSRACNNKCSENATKPTLKGYKVVVKNLRIPSSMIHNTKCNSNSNSMPYQNNLKYDVVEIEKEQEAQGNIDLLRKRKEQRNKNSSKVSCNDFPTQQEEQEKNKPASNRK